MTQSNILLTDVEIPSVDNLIVNDVNTPDIIKDSDIIATNLTVSIINSELIPNEPTQNTSLLDLNSTEYDALLSEIVIEPTISNYGMLLNPDIPVYDNAVPTDLSLNTNSQSNDDILASYEAITAIPETTPGSGSLFPSDPALLPQINSLFELLQYLSEVMMRFNSNPNYYMQDDFAVLVKTITNALIHLYLNAPLSTGEVEGIYTALGTKVDKIAGKGLSTNDLTNELLDLINSISSIPSQLQSDWTVTDQTLKSYIRNKPTNLSSFTNDLGNYGNFVTGTPWTQIGYLTEITKAQVESVLTGLITTHTHNYISSETDPLFTAWNKSTGISITKSQISDFPTIPSAQVQTDWNASSGISSILNKPYSLPASDVYAWAKTPSKPIYTYLEVGAASAATISFPGFGTTHSLVAYGDHNHSGVYQPIGSYLTSINSSDVITALGYTPYSNANPNGYITSSSLTPYALTSSIPNVHSWALATTKPTYTYSEVGAQAPITLTTNFSSGPATFDGVTLNIPSYSSSAGGGTSGTPIYFLPTSSITSGYLELGYTPYSSVIEIPYTVPVGTTVLSQHLYDSAINTTIIDAGNWFVSSRLKINDVSTLVRLHVDFILYHLDGSTTVLFGGDSDIISSTSYVTYSGQLPQASFTCVTTDRLGIIISAINSSSSTKTLTTSLGVGIPSYFTTPLAIRHSSLRDKNEESNYQHVTSTQITLFTNKQNALSGTGYLKFSGTTPSYDNSTFLTGITSSQVTTALGYTPVSGTPWTSMGYLTGITSGQVTGALGFTPYNATNPNSYISGINSSMVTTALGFTPYNVTNPNGYITSSALSPYQLSSTAITTSNIGSQSVNYANSTAITNSLVYNDGPRNLTDRLPTSFTRTVNFDFVSAGIVGGTGNYGGVMTYNVWDGTTAGTGDSAYQLGFLNETGINGSGVPGLKLRKGIDSTWGSWYTLITSGNIGSQSVNYASLAGNSTNLGGSAASAYQLASTAINTSNIGSQSVSYATNSSTAAVAASANSTNVYGGNETIIHNGITSGNSAWINYRGSAGSGITQYYFGNGLTNGGMVPINASQFNGSGAGLTGSSSNFSANALDVYSWAKASTKPSYSYSEVGAAPSSTVSFPGFGTTSALACVGNDSRLSDARTPLSHAHGNITNAGAIGSIATLPIITTTSGVLTTGSFGTTAGTFCQGSDSRLSDARTPVAHTHGNITNIGYIGTTATLPIITGTGGILQAGSFGTTAGTFCQGNDSRFYMFQTAVRSALTTINLSGTGDIYYTLINTSTATVNLPISPRVGQTIWIRPSGVNSAVTVAASAYSIWGGSATSSVSLDATGYAYIFTFDGTYWVYVRMHY